MTTWMVRAESGRLVSDFLDNSLVAIGWHELGDPSAMQDQAEYLEAVQRAYPDQSKAKWSVWAGVVRRFWHALQVGDYVVTSDPENALLHYGRIESGPRHDADRGEWPNYRRVTWTARIPRASLSPWTRRRLGSLVTLFAVAEEAARELAAFAAGEPPPPPPLSIQPHAREEFPGLFAEFRDGYLASDAGQQHLARYEVDRASGRANFEAVLAAQDQGQEIADLVLDRLLPYADVGENRAAGRWVMNAPVYKGPARNKHEGAGWQQPEDWPEAAAALVEFFRICRDDPDQYDHACRELAANPLAKGFQTGVLSPMLNALRPDLYHIHDLKTRRTLRFFYGRKFDQSIAAHPLANAALDLLVQEFAPDLATAGLPEDRHADLLDLFCHWLVAEKDHDFDRRYWIVRPGTDGENWDDCVRDGALRLGYGELGDLSRLTKQEFRARCSDPDRDHGIRRDRLRMLWRLRRLKPGDQVIAYRGDHEILGVGEVTEPYRHVTDREDPHEIRVRWQATARTRMPSVNWVEPVKSLDAGTFHRVAQALSSADHPAFTAETFQLLGQLEAAPEVGTYHQLKDQLNAHVRDRLVQLFENTVARMDAEVLDELETEQNIVSRFRKNDFGRGGAWPFLWVAAYPRGGSRVVGPQLFIRVEAGVLRYGLFVSASDRESLQRLRERAAQPAFRERFDALADLDLDVRPGEQADPLTIAEWLDAPAGESVSIARSLSTEAARTVPADQLAQQIADAFTALSSIYQLATKAAIDPAEPITAPNPTYTLAEMSRETGFAEEELQSWADAVDRKGQAILYGPPGTGKTYVAHRLARHLVSGGGGTIQAIQFHPAFAYEDFIQGLRPVVRDDGSLGYQVLPGRFLEFCEKARGRDGASVLIIDEINRADLARVFGELMYLLEYRDQAIPLAAGGKPFKIPGNVRIIGTMNTADRSIALVDHALRRRFAFLRLTPRYDVLEEFHDASDFPAAALHELLQRINRQIGDPSYWLGISYFLVEDLDEDLLQTIWQQEIEPYLEELFFDQPERMEKLRWSHVAPEIFA